MKFKKNTKYPLISDSATDAQKPFILNRSEHFDESRGSQRLQVVSGSQNMFAFPIIARFFHTSIVLRMLEHSAYPKDLQLQDPYKAMNDTNNAVNLRSLVELNNGKKLTASEFQQRLAEAALLFLVDNGGAQDEIDMATTWAAISDDLVSGHVDKWEQHLEWLAKQRLIERIADRHSFKTTNAQAAAIDIKWHQPRNIIQKTLRRQGRIAYMPSDESIAAAILEAPDNTRARVRGSLIAQHFNDGTLMSANWNHVHSDTGSFKLEDATMSKSSL